MEDMTVFVDYSIKQVVGKYVDEPDNYITDIKGNIYDYDEDGREITVGSVHLYYCDLERAFNNGIPSFEVLDAHSDSTFRYYNALLDIETGEINQSILELLGYDEYYFSEYMNFLIIDRIEILPEFRGRGLSKYVLEEAVKMFSNKTFAVVLEPFPLQGEPEEMKDDDRKEWDKKMDYSTFKENAEEAKEALTNHYRNLGFVEIPESGFMLCTNEEWV